ncbi:GNAT family N-acetyltransferase [Algimonas porphyrae]|uniref:N-acetyltransferase domain-containing protein n=1 Tax=Algimonas porphyrae TaxID=1128113 RepID=A0ABQ5UZC4_9PROT|nr:GNAT family N-acetyltransferase [Algimonas porphyrae]GLQ20644.1 hypothetical protein GCM10007854_15990 [Algimonas porphyrae]
MMVRVLAPSDAKAMAAIHAAGFDKGWSALDMAVHIERDLCLGTGTPLTAFMILRRSDVDAEILTITTHPDARSQGHAAALLRDAAQCLSGEDLRHIFLEVAEDNHAAKRLYERIGYRPIGRRPGYYARPGGRVAAITYGFDLR